MFDEGFGGIVSVLGDAGEAVTTDDAAAAEAPTSPPPPTPEELERACFESAWIPAFLERLGFTPDAKSIRWRARVGDTTELDASWVLGAAVCIASECR